MTSNDDARPGVAVVGAGGHAKVVIATLRAVGLPVAAVFDDDRERRGGEVLGVPVAGPVSALEPESYLGAVLAVGSNEARRRLAGELSVPWVTVVHPRAVVHPTVRLGEGAVIFAGAVVQPDAELGRHAIVNTGATVDHDCRIGAFAHLAPGSHLAGAVEVGEGALVGIGASVVQGRRIGAWATVGAGAAVVRDVPPGVTAAGVPARVLGGARGA